ncbi:MAG: hypothetical protein K8W52_15110 [Deltaproteobacteria bacterium]|nr:hypothetical protein [Deltaproteobacteria bacterium]
MRASERGRWAACAAALAIAVASPAARADAPGATDSSSGDELADKALAAYFTELGKANLVDAESGSKDTLTRELGAAENLLRDGAAIDAAVALYAIVYSPRYAGFHDFVGSR